MLKRLKYFQTAKRRTELESHFIKVVVRNDFTIPNLNKEKEIIAKEIALIVYPEIVNINDYLVIGVVFENITIEGAVERKDFFSAAYDTEVLHSEIKKQITPPNKTYTQCPTGNYSEPYVRKH